MKANLFLFHLSTLKFETIPKQTLALLIIVSLLAFNSLNPTLSKTFCSNYGASHFTFHFLFRVFLFTSLASGCSARRLVDCWKACSRLTIRIERTLTYIRSATMDVCTSVRYKKHSFALCTALLHRDTLSELSDGRDGACLLRIASVKLTRRSLSTELPQQHAESRWKCLLVAREA